MKTIHCAIYIYTLKKEIWTTLVTRPAYFKVLKRVLDAKRSRGHGFIAVQWSVTKD